ncbi:PH domain-containing protein [Kineococcus sp. R8]|uniref:PH domain-containing protein n=1 Tax=Kineococcus siccus TaxID=2696567 RepID=UPI0014131139|nr:PH domain-containing protein [Kineococcus siccus]NAZ81276.1 PH domain-containing protein [Kineococcus siccus]
MSAARPGARVDAPFRPRRARWVGYPLAALFLLATIALSISLARAPQSGWTGLDTVFALLFGLVVAGGIARLVAVRAVPTEGALVVRNIVYTRRVEWGAILGVRFSGESPWLTLDTDDGENLAVMAVQRADGLHADAEALRLARLVERHAPRAGRDGDAAGR